MADTPRSHLVLPSLFLIHEGPILIPLVRHSRFQERHYIHWRWPWERDGGYLREKPRRRVARADRCGNVNCGHKRSSHRVAACQDYAGVDVNDACEECPCWTYKEGR